MSWEIQSTFTSKQLAQLFTLMYPGINYEVTIYSQLCMWDNIPIWMSSIVGFDCAFIPYLCGSVVDWIIQIGLSIAKISNNLTSFHLATLWIPLDFAPSNLNKI